MKNILLSLSLLWVLAKATTACNTNNLRQESAEKAALSFLAANPIPSASRQAAPIDSTLWPPSASFGIVNQFAEHKSSMSAWLGISDSLTGKPVQ